MESHVTQELEGPFDHHVYIAYATADKHTVLDLRSSMEKKGLSCFVRSREADIHASIRDGVRRSRKCMIFLTGNYQKTTEDWFQIETEAILEKTERFSRDILVILKTESAKEVPEKLRGFKEIFFKPEKLKDEKFMEQLVDIFLQEPNAILTVVPKQNMGYASALGYFYGFLRLTLPEFRKRLVGETLKYHKNRLPNTVKKMLIIMPESCFCAIGMESPNKIEFTGQYVVRVANRAGNVKRDYKSSLYKLIDHHDLGKEYYFVGELATPLLTMYETYLYGLCNMTLDQLYTERDAFYFTLKAVLSHRDNVECNDQFRLLYWCDPETKKPNGEELYDFLRPVLKKELALEREKELFLEKVGEQKAVTSHRLESKKTFETVKTAGSNPSRIYDPLDAYDMTRKPRGICLIVNIVNFNKGNIHLTERRGGLKDTETLQNLFEDLHFTVIIHKDVSAQTLESLFLTMNMTDHSNYDAFVCCILTHGKLGKIYTSDGKEAEILELADYFTDKNCPTLKGKPKMFFIQACQSGQPGSVQDDPSRARDINRPIAGGSSRDENEGEKINVSSTSKETVTGQGNGLHIDAMGETGAPAISSSDKSKDEKTTAASPPTKATDFGQDKYRPMESDALGVTGAPASSVSVEDKDKDKEKINESSRPKATEGSQGKDLESDAIGSTGAPAVSINDEDKKKTAELSHPKVNSSVQNGHLESDAVGLTGAPAVSINDEDNKKTAELSHPKVTDTGQDKCLESDAVGNTGAPRISNGDETKSTKKLNEPSPQQNPDADQGIELQSDASGHTGAPMISSSTVTLNKNVIVPFSPDILRLNSRSSSKEGESESTNEDGSSLSREAATTVRPGDEEGVTKPLVPPNAAESVHVQPNKSETNSTQTDAQSAPSISGSEDETYFKHKAVLVPGSPDFLMSYSTLPGSISFRDTQIGSLYIQALDKCLRTEQEIDTVLKQVSREVKKNLEERGKQDGRTDRFQLPFHLTTGMYRLIYLG